MPTCHLASHGDRLEAQTITNEKEEPVLLTFREVARRVVEEGIAPSMSHQRVSQLSGAEGFPPVQKIGRAKVVDWNLARSFFKQHALRAAVRDSRRRFSEEEGADE